MPSSLGKSTDCCCGRAQVNRDGAAPAARAVAEICLRKLRREFTSRTSGAEALSVFVNRSPKSAAPPEIKATRRHYSRRRSTMRRRLLTLLSPDNHGQNPAFFFFLLFGSTPGFGGTRGCAGDQIRKGCVFQYLCGGVADIEKDLIERAVRQIGVDGD